MAIIKPGFQPGFRGRTTPPSLSRRAHYLAAQQGRDSARLLGMEGHELTPTQGIEAMGGKSAPYHEIIVAPSEAECRTILGRNPSDPSRAAEEAGQRLAKAYAEGRPYLLAIHEQDGRFHFHIAVRGSMPEQALGRHGSMQKHWDRELFGDEPRIQDWDAHQRFKAEKVRLQEVVREQRENERQRREAVKRAAPGRKAEAARPFERKARLLIERRFLTETAALRARYESRGMLGSPRHQAELEQAEHRRTGAVRRLEKRETSRELGVAKARFSRAVDQGGRVVQRGARVAGRVGRMALDKAMKELGVPAPLRKVSRAGLVLAQEATQATLRASMEAAKAAARSGIHVGQASVKLATGLVAALPTAGASLKVAGKEAGRDLIQAGKEAGHGAARTGAELGKGAGRAVAAGSRELLPQEVQAGVQMAATTARTAAGATKDLVTLSPLSLGRTLAGGATDLGATAARNAGLTAKLPEPVRRALQVIGWLPIVGSVSKVAEVAAETTQTVANAASRGVEVER
ncbi:hypothetical protein [Geothrix sp. PMB-07]|uniref:hypothetical protein n=1 Tax=Geothrix sp. PMB-07 TaxID=3068640 RepID=UPI002741540F|nr:hypothetical protein [Geothrix sp. PMB-07]WLT30883.1 hypothetical protein Q9293_14280 [Geothrix sp. PMB-07]